MGKIDLEEQYDKIYRYCYLKVQQREKAEDITQETFLRFYERFGHYGSDFTLQYMYRIAHNLCIDEFRKPVCEELPTEISKESHEDQVLTKLSVKDALSYLSAEEREILFLRYVNDVPMGVICKITGLSRFTLYRKLKNIADKLHDSIGREGMP